jgi:hypothetical protein
LQRGDEVIQLQFWLPEQTLSPKSTFEELVFLDPVEHTIPDDVGGVRWFDPTTISSDFSMKRPSDPPVTVLLSTCRLADPITEMLMFALVRMLFFIWPSSGGSRRCRTMR